MGIKWLKNATEGIGNNPVSREIKKGFVVRRVNEREVMLPKKMG